MQMLTYLLDMSTYPDNPAPASHAAHMVSPCLGQSSPSALHKSVLEYQNPVIPKHIKQLHCSFAISPCATWAVTNLVDALALKMNQAFFNGFSLNHQLCFRTQG